MNELIWNYLVSDQNFRQAVPPWARFLLEKSFADVQTLPLSVDSPNIEGVFRPTSKAFEVTASYLEFLRGEIKVEARGKKWSALLQKRLNALVPYEGKELGELVMSRREGGSVDLCWIVLEPASNKVVYVEQ